MFTFSIEEAGWGLLLSSVLFILLAFAERKEQYKWLKNLPWVVFFILFFMNNYYEFKGYENLFRVMLILYIPMYVLALFVNNFMKQNEEKNEFQPYIPKKIWYVIDALGLLFLQTVYFTMNNQYEYFTIYLIWMFSFFFAFISASQIITRLNMLKIKNNVLAGNALSQLCLQFFTYFMFKEVSYYWLVVLCLILGQLLSLSIDLYLREKKRAKDPAHC